MTIARREGLLRLDDLARKLTSLSTIEIGKRMGGRDHSTVIHAEKRVRGRLEKDEDFTKLLGELEQTIKNSTGSG